MNANHIKYSQGDATLVNPRETIIFHIVNNLGKWGKGFVVALSNRYPSSRIEYLRFCDDMKILHSEMWQQEVIGHVQMVELVECEIANLFAQVGILSKTNKQPLNYGLLTTCLEDLYDKIVSTPKYLDRQGNVKYKLQCPKLGAGLAGGDFTKIEPIIIKTLVNRVPSLDVTIFEWDK